MTLIFIDFKRVFESIHRGKTLNILRTHGILEQIHKKLNYYTKAQKRRFYQRRNKQNSLKYLLAGVLQGDTLAP